MIFSRTIGNVLASAEDFQAVGVDEGVEVDASCEQDFVASGDEFHPNDSLGVVEIKTTSATSLKILYLTTSLAACAS